MRYRSRLVVVLLLLTLINVSGWQDEHPRAVDRVSATVESQTPAPSVLDGPQQIYARSGLSTRDIQSLVSPTPVPTVAPPLPALRWPLAVKARITTYFHSWHRAIDLEARCGTSVLSAKSGRVTFAGWKTNGGGYVITITSGTGFVISYDHLSRIITSKGAYVPVGTRIGSVGATGNATGCHLHFAVLLNGRAVNPLRYL